MKFYDNIVSGVHILGCEHQSFSTCRLSDQTDEAHADCHWAKKPLSIMLATAKNVPFPGHNHLLTTVADDHLL